ncbi:uncharacterized protein LOC101779902 [Setaria italica]|uniref:uncharacterized protein LOC101779902 n=1 Tax=Setaria italica TaxID=4555 RepID=UPI0006458C1F|nr:uncharacterized protein LOC101779902 [Setaria italica]
MAAYCNKVRKLKDMFDGLELNHVTRRFNEAADELAKVASGRKPIPDSVFVSDQYKPSIRYHEPGRVGDAPPAPDLGADPGEVGNAPPVPDSGADLGKVGNAPLVLDSKADPSDPEVMEINVNPAEGPNLPLTGERRTSTTLSARRSRRTRRRHVGLCAVPNPSSSLTRSLYKRSHSGILQRYIPIKQGKALIQDIYTGACSHHATPRTLVGNAFRQGFYWPTAVADASHVLTHPGVFGRDGFIL